MASGTDLVDLEASSRRPPTRTSRRASLRTAHGFARSSLGLVVITMLAAVGCSGESDNADPSSTVAPTNPTVPVPSTAPPIDAADTIDTSPAPPSSVAPDASSVSAPAPSPAPTPTTADLEGISVGFDLVAEIDKPTAVAWRPDDPAMYVSTQPGPIYRVLDGASTVVLDLTDDTFPFAPGSERGILGIAFDPRDGRMFVDYTDRNDDTRVVSYELVDGVAIPESRREVLFIEQPGVGHNGGRLVFESSGNLIISSGDGGGSNGRDVEDTTKLLGVLLRIEPRLDGDGYLIPADNPFVDGVADRPEVLARGFRNPWTFSIDDDTGDIWIGDVGNDTMEEVSVLRNDMWGANFGWPYFEGTTPRRASDAPEAVVAPVHVYDRSVGVAVMAGHVYRGARIPSLDGAFLFADLGGPVWALGTDGVVRVGSESIRTVTGWAEGPDDELYLLGFEGIFSVVER